MLQTIRFSRPLLLAIVVMLGASQSAWAGEILIADQPLELDSPASAHMKSVSAAAPIYALMKLDRPIPELFFNRDKKAGTFDIDLNVAVDGEPTHTISLKAPQEAGSQTSYAFPLSAAPAEFGTDLKVARPASQLMKVLADQPAGKHTIKLQAAGRKPVVASGKFSVEITEADRTRLSASYAGVAEAVEDKKASLRTLPDPGAFTGAEVAQALEAAVQEKYPTTVRVVVMSDDWDVLRDEFTKEILRRSLLAAWGKSESDGTCYQDRGWWAQEYLGDGKYSAGFRETSLVSTSAESGRIDCDKIR